MLAHGLTSVTTMFRVDKVVATLSCRLESVHWNRLRPTVRDAFFYLLTKVQESAQRSHILAMAPLPGFAIKLRA